MAPSGWMQLRPHFTNISSHILWRRFLFFKVFCISQHFSPLTPIIKVIDCFCGPRNCQLDIAFPDNEAGSAENFSFCLYLHFYYYCEFENRVVLCMFTSFLSSVLMNRLTESLSKHQIHSFSPSGVYYSMSVLDMWVGVGWWTQMHLMVPLIVIRCLVWEEPSEGCVGSGSNLTFVHTITQQSV